MGEEGVLREKGQLREYVFTSTTPVIGGLIARFRAAWNGISTRWYVRPLVAQQTEFNQALLNYVLPRLANYDKHLRTFEENMRTFEENLPRFDEIDARIIAQDRHQADMTHDVGEVVAHLVQIDRRLDGIEARIERLETSD